MQPIKPGHADYTQTIGHEGRFALRRYLTGYSYPRNGNVHNPTPYYRWLLLLDGRIVDQFNTRREVIEAARLNGHAYLAD